MLTAQWLYGLAGCLIVGLGLRSALLQAALLQRVIAINVMGSGVFLVLNRPHQKHPIPRIIEKLPLARS